MCRLATELARVCVTSDKTETDAHPPPPWKKQLTEAVVIYGSSHLKLNNEMFSNLHLFHTLVQYVVNPIVFRKTTFADEVCQNKNLVKNLQEKQSNILTTKRDERGSIHSMKSPSFSLLEVPSK